MDKQEIIKLYIDADEEVKWQIEAMFDSDTMDDISDKDYNPSQSIQTW